MVNGGSSIADSDILKGFLNRPHDRRRQRAFVEMCIRLTIGYLRYLRAKGWSLPIVQQGGSPLRDLAMDIVGALLASKRNSPYYKVFEFFRRRGYTDFDCTDATELYDAFRALLYRFIRQERSKLMDEEEPQKALLKRAFRDVLKTDEYHTWTPSGARSECVCAAKYAECKREGCPSIPFEDLLALVEKAYLQSTGRRRWCRAIFDLLNGDQSVQNFVKRHRLLQAVVIVNLRYVDAEAFTPAPMPDAERELVAAAIKRARTETLSWARKSVLAGFVAKGRLTDGYADCLLVACENCLVDLAHSPGTDLLPVYFRDVMPRSEHSRYLKDFKHIFETLIHQARDDFEERLRNFL